LSFPSIVAVIVIGYVATRSGARPALRLAITAGVVGGLLGTLGYDVFRIPFHAIGYRLLAPIDSYGVLLLDAPSSSALTGFAGWTYHFANGLGFGIAYAVVALGRRWYWGVAWAMVLETATIATPFAGTYAIAGKWHIIAIAYAAHVAYGVPLGRWVERADVLVRELDEAIKYPITASIGVLGVGLLAWHQPWSVDGDDRAGERVGPGPSAVVRRGQFAPKWLRVGVGGCALIRNEDGATYAVKGVPGAPPLPPDVTQRVCFPEEGVHRVRTSSKPDAGGFVIVDPAMPKEA
jgi:hypothetical protein